MSNSRESSQPVIISKEEGARKEDIIERPFFTATQTAPGTTELDTGWEPTFCPDAQLLARAAREKPFIQK